MIRVRKCVVFFEHTVWRVGCLGGVFSGVPGLYCKALYFYYSRCLGCLSDLLPTYLDTHNRAARYRFGTAGNLLTAGWRST